MALPLVALAVAGTAFSIAGAFRKSDELRKQLELTKKLIALQNEGIVARREQQLYDNDRRAKIVSGQVISRSGFSGVASSSSSVINAVADVAAQTAVDKMRINFNADLQLRESALRLQETGRQQRVAGQEAFIQSIGFGISGAADAFTAFKK